MDFTIMGYGEVLTLDPISDEARTWIHSNISNPVVWGSGIVLEDMEVADIMKKIVDEDFAVSVDESVPKEWKYPLLALFLKKELSKKG